MFFHCDSVVLKICLDHKFQWLQEGLNYESLKYNIVTEPTWPSGFVNYFVSKRFAVQTLLWSLEFVILINLEHDTIAVFLLFLNTQILFICFQFFSDYLCYKSLLQIFVNYFCYKVFKAFSLFECDYFTSTIFNSYNE